MSGRQGLGALAWLLLTLAAHSSFAAQPPCAKAPPLRMPPEGISQAPPARSAPEERLARFADGNRGIGFVKGPSGAFPWQQSTLPLYSAPSGKFVGWLHKGWVLLDDHRAALPPAAIVETGYEQTSLIVTQARDDGWIELVVDDAHGRAWTHVCRLDQGEVALSLVRYRDLYLGEISGLSFRSPLRHALRAEPSTSSRHLRWVEQDDELEPQRIVGDWMEVVVERPGKYWWLCGGGAPSRPWAGETFTGWVQWKDATKGTWLYWPTRGC